MRIASESADVQSAAAPHTCTLLLTCPISDSAELWAPFRRRVLEAHRDSPVRVGAAWGVESPNRGAAARPLVPAPLLNLVAVTDSAGAVAIFFAGTVPEPRARFRAFVMVESPDIPQQNHVQLAHHVAAFTRYNAGRPAHWPSRAEGVHFLRTHRPWKAFHPEAPAVACTTSGARVLKTPPAHESATWADFRETGALVRRLEQMVAVGIVGGGVRTFWCVRGQTPGHGPRTAVAQAHSELEAALNAVHERLRRSGAEVRVVEGAGHYVPQEKVDELVQVVL
ncbi:hypothetical protein FA95DRAFT_1573196 [Auriscalpium vulgare]|uniref:Uncharacterized protein n=1 Tax=Auriscalpium vulgare TaxID=40419 RepID=A0ACB8RQT1_9AGAM|nr:hypothetical protein FA95DRAFT_1573196 [Auriscalpium vulgare]